MKQFITSILCFLFFNGICVLANAQCSICTKTVQQLGEKPARGLDDGILYLMAAPFLIVGVIAYRWWKTNGQEA